MGLFSRLLSRGGTATATAPADAGWMPVDGVTRA